MIFSQGCARHTELLIAKKWCSECLCGLPDTLSTFLNIQCLEFVFSRRLFGALWGVRWFVILTHFHLCLHFNYTFYLWTYAFVRVIQKQFCLTSLHSMNSPRFFMETLWCHVKIALQILNPFFAGYQSILFSVLNSWGSADCNLSEITTSRLGEP